ncbi:MAG: nucleotidyl transferase AbiEii/AbiGii toxin family protein [Phycisphaerae bacterium]|nr:nucleotidyl transferase AbiEii/AbiGii toxin family protein [Phycisphaerae bacterium]
MTKGKPKDMAASVRQRLLDIAHARNEDFQLVLIHYGIERLLYRLSRSAHRDAFVLKGAMLFELWTGHMHRSTLDVDLSGKGEESVARFVEIFKAICAESVEDDGLTFQTTSIRGEEIREDQQYAGVRITLSAKLGVARIPLQIDIGFGDVITPRASRVEFPAILPFPAATIRAYPKETVVAEKYQAMVALGIANSRMKDFFDIWVLSNDNEFDGAVLSQAIKATFRRRATPLPERPPLALTSEFATDALKQTQWRAFVRKGRLAVEPTSFDAVVKALVEFLWPPTEALVAGGEFVKTWVRGRPWR